MKHLFYLYCIVAIAYSISSCSKEDESAWKYGEKQVLENSEWVYTAVVYGGSVPERSFNFKANGEYTYSATNNSYNEELQKLESSVIVTQGKYQYKHPKLKLIFEDGLEIEAWISAKNSICFNEDNGVSEFVRQ